MEFQSFLKDGFEMMEPEGSDGQLFRGTHRARLRNRGIVTVSP